MGVFPEFDSNIHTQFWIAARYMESISFLLAPLLLTGYSTEYLKKSNRYIERARFAREVFLAYTGITVICLLSIFVFKNFPDSYIEGSGVTHFKMISEYVISFILLCSLIALYAKKDRSLKLDPEEVHPGMDTAIPLGIIVNELVSNSLKYAFPSGKEGEILISLHRAEDYTSKPGNSGEDRGCKNGNYFDYTLTVGDNGKGIPEEVDSQNPESLGLQLVNILVEQIDGCIELKRDHGTEFTIRFNNPENE